MNFEPTRQPLSREKIDSLVRRFGDPHEQNHSMAERFDISDAVKQLTAEVTGLREKITEIHWSCGRPGWMPSNILTEIIGICDRDSGSLTPDSRSDEQRVADQRGCKCVAPIADPNCEIHGIDAPDDSRET